MSRRKLPPLETLGARITLARTLAELSPMAFAVAVDVHYRSIENWEANRNVPQLRHLQRISTVTNVPLSWLAGEVTA